MLQEAMGARQREYRVSERVEPSPDAERHRGTQRATEGHRGLQMATESSEPHRAAESPMCKST